MLNICVKTILKNLNELFVIIRVYKLELFNLNLPNVVKQTNRLKLARASRNADKT